MAEESYVELEIALSDCAQRTGVTARRAPRGAPCVRERTDAALTAGLYHR
ncbi:hypothetical protein [Streptomyces sp. NPDC002889]